MHAFKIDPYWYMLAAAVVFCAGVWYTIKWYFIFLIRKDLKATPKKPMILCDKGHLYEASLSLKISDIPGTEAPVDLCPICFDSNMRTAEKESNGHSSNASTSH